MIYETLQQMQFIIIHVVHQENVSRSTNQHSLSGSHYQQQCKWLTEKPISNITRDVASRLL